MPLLPDRCYVIGDIGCNFMGDKAAAFSMIANLAACGADAAKFQLFTLPDILKDPTKGDKRWELPVAWLEELANMCDRYGIDFLCTPFAPWAVHELNPFVDTWKIASFEQHRRDLWAAVERTAKPVISSLGRSRAWSRPHKAEAPTHLLYCVSKYPTPTSDIYLPNFVGDHFKKTELTDVCGFSDHTTSTVIPALAVARGAHIVEKHFRLDDTTEESPDHPHSLPPAQFAEMVENIRAAEVTCWRQPPAVPMLVEYPNRLEIDADGTS